MTGLRPEGYGRLSAAGCVSLRSGGDSACGAEGGGLPLCGNAYKVSVTGFAFSVIWHENNSADWLAALASPYPASPDFPLFRGKNKSLYAFLQRHGSIAKHP